MRKLLTISIIFVVFACNREQPLMPDPVITTLSVMTPLSLDSLVPTKPLFGNYDVPANNPTTEEGVQLGRMLFYEKMLSGDNTMSCATCHQQAFAFTDGEATSKGIDGIAGNRSAMSVQNMLWDSRFFWDGRALSLEEQALAPIQNPIELHQSLKDAVDKLRASDIYPQWFYRAFGDNEINPERIAKAIAQFERTLISANSRYDKWQRGEVQFTDEELRGFQLMVHPEPPNLQGGNCSDCHKFNTFTESEGILRNNGVDVVVGDIGLEAITDDPNDRGKMKIPTLRNIEMTAPYMHDGRFTTLEEVLDHYNATDLRNHENVDVLIKSAYNNEIDSTLSLTVQQKTDIIAFLKTLTDQEFLTNPDFSDPF